MASRPICVTGRRKTSTARVYIKPASGETQSAEGTTVDGMIVVNGRTFTDYFPRPTQQMLIRQPLELTERISQYEFKVTVDGGGPAGQAGAVLHGISRALIKIEPALRSVLKKGGFLTRDARKVERKKPGRHKARKRPQFSKR